MTSLGEARIRAAALRSEGLLPIPRAPASLSKKARWVASAFGLRPTMEWTYISAANRLSEEYWTQDWVLLLAARDVGSAKCIASRALRNRVNELLKPPDGQILSHNQMRMLVRLAATDEERSLSGMEKS